MKNECPVCKSQTKEDEKTTYCEKCGLSIRKQPEGKKPKEV